MSPTGTTAAGNSTENTRKTRTTAGPAGQEAALLAAAAEEFLAVGVRRANVDAVAARAGVSRSTLYRRFPNKDALLLAVATDTYERGMALLEESVVGLSPREAVVVAFTVGASLVAEDPLIHRLVLTDRDMKGITGQLNALFIDVVTERVVRTLRTAGARMPESDLRDAVGLHVRLVISFLEVPTDDERQAPDHVREVAEKFLAPMIW